ncbi:MAG TPA: hypothetical protein PL169_22835, partial [Leptospiraceae bacterium]|nr:hypothetical protein [Leptospiraceae bacterium]
DTPIIHPGLGASYPVFEIKSAEGQNSRHPNDIRTLIWGALLVQHNECLAPLIDFYPIDYSYRYRETCQSKNGWNSAFKLNLWGSAGIGIHFEANLSRTLNFIPELFLLTDARQTFWNITDTGNSPRFAYEFTKPQSIEKILNWKIIEGITEPTYFQSIEICKVYAMHPASKDESYNIRLFIKDKSNNLICVKEK